MSFLDDYMCFVFLRSSTIFCVTRAKAVLHQFYLSKYLILPRFKASSVAEGTHMPQYSSVYLADVSSKLPLS